MSGGRDLQNTLDLISLSPSKTQHGIPPASESVHFGHDCERHLFRTSDSFLAFRHHNIKAELNIPNYGFNQSRRTHHYSRISLIGDATQRAHRVKCRTTSHRHFPTELVLMISSWRALQAGPTLHKDLLSLCLASSLLEAAARPHMYKVISVGDGGRIPALEAQLRGHPRRCEAVRAAWWGTCFDKAHSCLQRMTSASQPIPLPNIEHVAWVSHNTPLNYETGPTGYHFATRYGGPWSAATPQVPLEDGVAHPLSIASSTPRGTSHLCALVQAQRVSARRTFGTPSVITPPPIPSPPKRVIWALHIVTPLESSVRLSVCRILAAIPTITHLTLTKYAIQETHLGEEGNGLRTLLHVLLKRESFPQLQSLVVRVSRATMGGTTACCPSTRAASWVRDSRLRFEEIPGDINWSKSAEAVASYTRHQWAEAVSHKGGPWGSL